MAWLSRCAGRREAGARSFCARWASHSRAGGRSSTSVWPTRRARPRGRSSSTTSTTGGFWVTPPSPHHHRRQPGAVGGAGGGLPLHAPSAVLVSQDAKRREEGPQAQPGGGGLGRTKDLRGPQPPGGHRRLLAMSQAVARAGAQGGGVHRERPRDVVGPLPRAPRPSGHPAHDKPH